MNGAREIYVAGIGAVCAAGERADAFWQALFHPPAEPDRNAIAFPSDPSSDWRHAYRIPDSPARPRELDAMALSAIIEALHDAKRRGHALDDRCTGLAVGTAAGDTQTAEQRRIANASVPFNASNPYGLLGRLQNRLPVAVSGPSFVNANACAAGLYALAHAVQLLRAGMADAMIVIGADILSRVTQAGFQRMTALDPDSCRPFDSRRQGTVLGEGAAAAILVASPAERATASTYCRVAGIGLSCDAHHPTAPQPHGREIMRAIDQALLNAQAAPADIDLVIPHGTGTHANDRIEAEVLASIFGNVSTAPPLLSIKSHIGHTAGASGLFSILAAAFALELRQVPCGGSCGQPDPTLRVRIPDALIYLKVRKPLRALVNACAFGGNNVSLILQGDAP